jgi:uncharacterized metal-binding protein (TIGR02443 family)
MTYRRFIAGAECPYCREIDCVVVEFDEQHRIMTRQCLGCGRMDELPESTTLAESPDADEAVRPIRFDG